MSSVQTEMPKPPDGGWGYVCIVAVFLLRFLFAIVVRTFGLIYLMLLDRFNTTPTLASWVGATNLLIFAISAPISAILCRTFSHRSVAIAGSVLNCLGFIIVGYSDNIGTVYLGFGLFAGIGIAMTDVASNLILDKYFLTKKSIAVSIVSCGSGTSMFVLPSLMNYCEEEYGFQGTILLIAGILLNGVVCAALLRPVGYSSRPSKRNIVLKNKPHMFFQPKIYGITSETNFMAENVVLTSAKKLDGDKMSELKVSNLIRDNVIAQIGDATIKGLADVGESTKKSAFNEHHFEKCEADKKDQLVVYDNIALSNDKGCNNKGVNLNLARIEEVNYRTYMSQENKYRVVQVTKPTQESTPQDENKNGKQNISLRSCVALVNDVPAVIGLLIFTFALAYSSSIVIAFLPALVIDKGILEEHAKLLISWAGISDVVLQIPFGFIMDSPKIRPYRIHFISVLTLIPAAMTLTFPFYSKHLPFAIGVVVFGGIIGIPLAHRITVTSYLTGTQWIQQAYGFVVTFHGFGHVTGMFIGGIIKDHTGSYEIIFFISGSILTLSAVIFLVMTICCWTNRTL